MLAMLNFYKATIQYIANVHYFNMPPFYKLFKQSAISYTKTNLTLLKSLSINGLSSDSSVNKKLSLKWLKSTKVVTSSNNLVNYNFDLYSENFWYYKKNVSQLKYGYSYVFSINNIIAYSRYFKILNTFDLFRKSMLKATHSKNVKAIHSNFTKEGRLRQIVRGYCKKTPLLEFYFPLKSKRILRRKALRIKYVHFKKLFLIKDVLYSGIKKNIKPNFDENTNSRTALYFYKNQEVAYLKNDGIPNGFPIKNNLKRSLYYLTSLGKRSGDYRDYISTKQYIRHPSTQFSQIKKALIYGTSLNFGYNYGIVKPKINIYAKFYRISWRYFKFKIEKFFYMQLGVRVHIWFLNIWDIFLNGVDSLWRWHRYEEKTMRFLMKKGKRFFIEGRENAKFYIRTMTLTLTMVGGVKLFLDKISVLMRKYRNNWAFIVSTMRTLRFCINFFWFRFFINYKITLQGKIGGFLRAQKKIFKKGNITIEDKSCAITYYRGYPVTRFGAYNLSFWLQYRIPNLIEKFEDMEYIDTMKILLGTYSVSWLAFRLAEIVKEMLLNRIAMIKRKVAQYNRRIQARRVLMSSVLKKQDTFRVYGTEARNLKPYTTMKKLVKNTDFFTKPGNLNRKLIFKVKN